MASPFTESTLEAVTETEFLSEMEHAVPWDRLGVLVAPLIQTGLGGGDMRGIGAETLMRIYMLRRWLALSSRQVLKEVQRVPRYRIFALGQRPGGALPDETTLNQFADLVWSHERTRRVVETIESIVEEDMHTCAA